MASPAADLWQADESNGMRGEVYVVMSSTSDESTSRVLDNHDVQEKHEQVKVYALCSVLSSC